MARSALIVGGAGFIGSYVADELIETGHRVRVLDNLCRQVHGKGATRPTYLNEDAELIIGDVRDPAAVRKALAGVDAVFHFAAAVGVGQSMYQIVHYVSTNDVGTAVLLEELIHHPVETLVVASSMSVYGEGLYADADGQEYHEVSRRVEDIRRGHWEPLDVQRRPLSPLPTDETKSPSVTSVYALSKYDQERLCLMTGQAYGMNTVALRLFNVFGPRQALSNPYTGVLAIFASRLINDRPPLIYEDGLQQRDFVSVHDVARAARLAMETPEAAGMVFNIASGRRYTIRAIAAALADVLDKRDIEPDITGKFRMGDIRHCFADISKARRVLGYQPRVSLEHGLAELAEWLDGRVAADATSLASAELEKRGLAI